LYFILHYAHLHVLTVYLQYEVTHGLGLALGVGSGLVPSY